MPNLVKIQSFMNMSLLKTNELMNRKALVFLWKKNLEKFDIT